MAFAPENFPIYLVAQNYKFPGAEQMRADFEAAAAGGVTEKFNFALSMFGVTQDPVIGKIPVITPAMIEQTREQIYLVFSEGAEAGDPNSAMMAAFMKATGQGTPEDRWGAIALIDKAEKITGPTPFSKELRQRATPVVFSKPDVKQPGQ